jgi:type VI secretion system protein ImpJ
MLLQLVNRAQPLIQHMSQLSPLHPERFFSELVSLAGEFSTFSRLGAHEYPAVPARRPGAELRPSDGGVA